MRNGKLVKSRSGDPKILDQGIVITGDLVVKLLGLKLLPINVRLLISSKNLAEELKLDWWRQDDRSSDGAGRRAAPKPPVSAAGSNGGRRRPSR